MRENKECDFNLGQRFCLRKICSDGKGISEAVEELSFYD